MKALITMILVLILSGCANMTPAEKTVALVVVGAVVAGVALSGGSSSTPKQNCYIAINGPTSNRVCH